MEKEVVMGLKRQHHRELNKSKIDPKRYKELREKYKNDPVALQQIDVYDPGATAYHDHLGDYVRALKARNDVRADELEAWFHEHYPDVS